MIDQYGTQFENAATGRGSDAHKKHLKKEIKLGLYELEMKELGLKELTDEAEKLIAQYQKSPSEKIKDKLRIVKKYLDMYIKAFKQK